MSKFGVKKIDTLEKMGDFGKELGTPKEKAKTLLLASDKRNLVQKLREKKQPRLAFNVSQEVIDWLESHSTFNGRHYNELMILIVNSGIRAIEEKAIDKDVFDDLHLGYWSKEQFQTYIDELQKE